MKIVRPFDVLNACGDLHGFSARGEGLDPELARRIAERLRERLRDWKAGPKCVEEYDDTVHRLIEIVLNEYDRCPYRVPDQNSTEDTRK